MDFAAQAAQPDLSVLDELKLLDEHVYQGVARSHAPRTDAAMRQLSRWADHSKLWLGIAAVMATVGGERGRRAAVNGVVSIGLASATTNLVGKQLARRPRPDRERHEVPAGRWVTMPVSTSFPSGHAASAFAFAEGVGFAAPPVALPVRILATAVSYSRIHVGVHYPGDVVVGALIGTACSTVACGALDVLRRRVRFL